MPAKPRWLLHIPEILGQLRAVDFPLLDRAMCERLFGVGRRRAIDLMQRFGGYRSGNTVLVDRLELIAQLERLEQCPDALGERRRKVRLAEKLDSLRRYQRASTVMIPAPDRVQSRSLPELPAGVALQAGQLTVEFAKTAELLQRLYAIAQAAAYDYDAFQAAVERNDAPP